MFVFVHSTFDTLAPRGPKLMNVHVATIHETSKVGAVIKAVERAFPADASGLGHLKRILKSENGTVRILLAAASDDVSSFVDSFKDALSHVHISQIPADLPRKDVDDPLLWSARWQVKMSVRLNDIFLTMPQLTSEEEQVLTELCQQVSSNKSVILYDPRRNFRLCEATPDDRPIVGSSVMKAIAMAADIARAWNESHGFHESYYFLTHCWAVMYREPSMCDAMALLHSRVARVVFCVPDYHFGVLGSRMVLHLERQLNHHFQVFWRDVSDQPSQSEG
jgi:hypothetical protein